MIFSSSPVFNGILKIRMEVWFLEKFSYSHVNLINGLFH